jgi:hypothetical protein
MRIVGRLLGQEIDRRVKPVIAVTFTYAVFSSFWVYVGVFAVKGLGGLLARSCLGRRLR